MPRRSHLYIFNFGLGQQELFVIVTLPLFPLRLELQHSFLGLSQPLPEVCDLNHKKNKKKQKQSGTLVHKHPKNKNKARNQIRKLGYKVTNATELCDKTFALVKNTNKASDANGYIWGSAVQTRGCTVSLQIVEADSFLAALRRLRMHACVRVCACVCVMCVFLLPSNCTTAGSQRVPRR